MKKSIGSIYLLMAIFSLGFCQENSHLICGFERSEVLGWGAVIPDSVNRDSMFKPNSFGYYKNLGTAIKGDATQDSFALANKVTNNWGFLNPGNQTSYYDIQRIGKILNFHGFFSRALPTDWSGYAKLWIDLKIPGSVGARIRLELEDKYLRTPIVRNYQVPAGQWVTLEVDLLRAVSERGMDLTRMSALQMMITALLSSMASSDSLRPRVDNIRLAEADAEPSGATVLLNDTSSMVVVPSAGVPVNLADYALAADGTVTEEIEYINITRASYGVLAARERAIGGFGTSGLIVYAKSGVYLSVDAGRTWTGLNGLGTNTVLSGNMRQQRATVLIDGTDIMGAYVPYSCAGGGGRTDLLFIRANYANGHYSYGPEKTFETGIWHCTDAHRLFKTVGGRIWVAWGHAPRWAWDSGEIHAKYSDDGGATWQDGGQNGYIALSGSAPFLTDWNGQVACFFGDKWSCFNGTTWSTPATTLSGATAYSVVTSLEGVLYLSTQAPNRILRYEGGAWNDITPAFLSNKPLLTRCSDHIAAVWDASNTVLMGTISPTEDWNGPLQMAAMRSTHEGLAVPQHSPDAFVPVAWSTSDSGGLYVRAYNMGQIVKTEKTLMPTVSMENGLFQSHPNPFNHSMLFQYRVMAPGPVSLKIFSATGRLVTELVKGEQMSGQYTAAWIPDGSLSTGIYFARLTAKDRSFIKQLVLMQ
ncbi:MAG: T9SS type A sorting domain-containing protein [Fibrobacterota bacterium]